MRKNVLLLLGIIFLWVFQVNAQWSITDVQTQFSIDFENTVNGVSNGIYNGTGFAENPAVGQLDAHAWATDLSPALFKDFGEEATESIYALGSSGGGVSTGGIYAFEVEPGNYALGIQPTGTVFTPGWLGLKIVNNTGQTIDYVEFSYDVWVYNDQNRSQTFNGEFSLDGQTWLSIEELEFITPLEAVLPAQWEKTTLTFDGPLGFELDNGESLYFRWFTDDFDGGGSRDEIAVDNINIIVSPVGGCETITEFPFYEDFNGDWEEWCWTVIDNDGDGNTWSQSNQYISPTVSEPYAAHGMGNQDDYLITPEIYLDGNYLISWWDKVESAGNPNEYYVKVSTTGNEVGDFTEELDFYVVTNTTWTQRTLDLSAYNGQTIYIAFHQTFSNSNWWGFGIDDVEIRQASNENDILDFTLAEQYEPTVIDPVNHTVSVIVAMGTDLTTLTPEITVSEHATIDPESGVTLDFTIPVTYTVTAESQLEQDWVVTVTESLTQSSENDILTFSFPEQTGPAVIDNIEKTVDIEVVWTANIANLTPSITISEWASINPPSLESQDFSDPFLYTVTAEDNTEAIWTVSVGQAEAPYGANCANPIIVSLPAQSPYEEIDQTNCGLENIYNNLCGSNYFNGEDILYQLEITENSHITLDFTPNVNYTGVGITNDCPDVGECMEYFTFGFGTSGITQTMNFVLSEGTYFLIISTWPAPDCINSFDLTITADPNACIAPTNLATTEIWQEEAIITWTAGLNETEWNILYGETGFDIDTEGILIAGELDMTYIITGLTESTVYDVYVQAVCGGEESEWSQVLTFTTLAACPTPNNLYAENITDFSADIGWTAVGGTDLWNIKVSDVTIDPVSEVGNIVDETTIANPFSIIDLQSNTNYYVYVQAVCGIEESEWTESFNFKTECGLVVDFPFIEGFEDPWSGAPAAPDCWTVVNGEPGSYWEQSGIQVNSGDFAARSYQGFSSDYVADEWLISPAIDFDNINTAHMIFYGHSNQAPDGYRENMRVLLLDQVYHDVQQLHANATLIDIVPFTQSWEEYLVNLGQLEGTKYVAFNYHITDLMPTSFNWIYIDDIHIDEAPECPNTTGLFADNITLESAELFWTEMGSATVWNVKVSDSQIDPELEVGNIADDFAEAIPYAVFGLEANTTYWFYIQADCGGIQSDWIGSQFHTECDVFTVFPYTEDFENNGEIPNCWINEPTNDYDWTFIASHTGSGGQITVDNTTGSGYFAFFNSWSSGQADVGEITSPVLALDMLENPVLEFYWNRPLTGYSSRLEVNIYANGEWHNDIYPGLNYQTDGWEYVIVDIGEYSYPDFSVQFHVTSDWYRNIGLDDVTVREMSNENDIIDFVFAQQTGPAFIDNAEHTVNIEVAMGSDLSDLTPNITISQFATINPESGISQDFTAPFVYTVTSESQIDQVWTIFVTEATTQSSENDILTFSFPEETGPAIIDNVSKTVDIEVNWIADLANLTPEITISILASIDPPSGEAQDFSEAFVYIVNAEDLTEAVWTVNVTQEIAPLGANCSNPIMISLPAQAPYEEIDQTNCGLENIYSSTCLGNYDTGDDIIYQIEVTENSLVHIEMTPNVAYTGMAILDECPDTGVCIESNTQGWGTANQTLEIEAILDAGTYYLIISTWGTQVGCIDAFDLIINANPDACIAPTNLATIEIWQEEVTITWTPGLNEAEWNILYGETGFDIETEGILIEGELDITYIITGLTESTVYDVYVQAACGGMESEWSNVLTFTTLALCPTPADIYSENVTESSANIGWNAIGETDLWNVKVSDIEIDPVSEEGNIADVTTLENPYHVIGLTDNTTYYVYVQAVCGGEESEWVGPYSFTTPCIPYELPFAEDFTGIAAGSIPDCWDRTHTNWGVNNTSNAGGSAPEMRFNWSPSTTDALKLMTPYIDGTNAGNIFLSFLHMVNDYEGDYDLKVQITTDGETWFDIWHEYVTADIPAEELDFDISAYAAGEEFRIAWVFDGYTFGINQWYIDNINIFGLYEIAEIDINQDVLDVDVCLGTVEAEVLELLVDQISISDSNGGIHVVDVMWTIENYNPDVSGTYLATGTFELPEGVIQTEPETELVVYADVIVHELPEVTCPADMILNDFSVVDLEGTALPEGGEFTGIGIMDNQFDPQGLENGDYIITYTYADPVTGCENYCEFTITLDIPQIADIDVNNEVENIEVCLGTDEATAIATLVQEITITDTEDNEHIVSLDWIIENYNADLAGIYAATGSFELPENVVQTDPATELNVHADVIVIELPVVTCPEDMIVDELSIVELEGTALPEGGEFSGMGVTDNQFDPLGLENDDYIITYTYTDPVTGCENYCEFIITVDIPVGIAKDNELGITIYPNPNQGQFLLNLSNIDGKVNYRIYDTKGSIILSDEFENHGNAEKEININVAPGIYYIKLINVDNVIIEKIIIQ